MLDVCQRDEVERGDPFVQSIDNLNEFGVSDGPIHITVALGEAAIEVAAADEYLRLGHAGQCPAAAWTGRPPVRRLCQFRIGRVLLARG